MRCFILSFAFAASVVALLVGRQDAQAEPLSEETYCALSIARLQLAQDTWERMRRGPMEAEEAVLWRQHGTTAEEYYTFPSAHHKDVERHLASYPEIQAQIERLSERLEQLIDQAEGQ